MIKYVNTGKKPTPGDCIALANNDEISINDIFRLLVTRKDGADILNVSDHITRSSVPDTTKFIYLGDSLLVRALSISLDENCYGENYYKNIPFPPAINDIVLCAVSDFPRASTKFRKGKIIDISDNRDSVEVSFEEEDTFLVSPSDCIRI